MYKLMDMFVLTKYFCCFRSVAYTTVECG